MLKRTGLGLVFALATTLSDVVIFKYQRNILSYFNDLLLIPQILYGVAVALTFPASLEFTIAQSPMQMRGMMLECGLPLLELFISLISIQNILLAVITILSVHTSITTLQGVLLSLLYC